MSTSNVLRMRGIARSYQVGPERLDVLTNVDLDVQKGEWVAIVGASGSGKSTLLNIMGLLDRPDSGRYELGGVAVSTLDDKARTLARNQMIGFVFQQHHLLPQLNVLGQDEDGFVMMIEGGCEEVSEDELLDAIEFVPVTDPDSRADLFFSGELQALQTRLETMTGKRIELSQAVDPELLGGVQVRVGDQLIEAAAGQ